VSLFDEAAESTALNRDLQAACQVPRGLQGHAPRSGCVPPLEQEHLQPAAEPTRMGALFELRTGPPARCCCRAPVPAPGEVRLAPCRLIWPPARIGHVGSEVAVVRVMLVDDQPPVLRAMAALVEETPGFEVVGRVVSGEEAVTAAALLLPDVVVMDVNLPGIDGLEATRRILSHSPATMVLLVSTYDEEAGASFVTESGAAAYVTKARFGPDQLEKVWSGS
jgi:CheY-like chemotaxis protein